MSTSVIDRCSKGYVRLSWKNRLRLVRMALSSACVGVVHTYFTETLILKEADENPLSEKAVLSWNISWFGELCGFLYRTIRVLTWLCLIVELLALNPASALLSLFCVLFLKIKNYNQGAMVHVEFGKREPESEQ